MKSDDEIKRKYYFGNERSWFKRTFIPLYIKSPMILEMSSDKTIALEKVGYMFGWTWWKVWKYAKLTGRIFKRVRSFSPEAAQDHLATTGEDLFKLTKSENIIVYDSESFTPHEYEPFMTVKIGFIKQ